MRKSLVSLVALGLFIGAPALVDTAAAESTTDTTASQSDTSGTTTGQTGTTTEELASERSSAILDSDRINQMFGEAQFEESTDIEGRIARAMTSDGHDVLVFIGPSDMGTGDRVELEDSDLRSRFQEGGFTGLQVFEDAHIVRADLDEDHYIFALAADELSSMHSPLSSQTGGQTQTDVGTAMDQTDTGSGAHTTMGQTGGQAETGMDVGTGTGTAMGETDTETDTQTGTAMGETDTGTDVGTDTQTSTAMGETDTGTDVGTDTQTDTQTGTAMGETDTGTDAQTSTAMGETETGTDVGTDTQTTTAMGETDTGTDTQTDTQTGTAMGETGTETDTQTGTAMGETGTGTETQTGSETETAMGTGSDAGTDTQAGVTGDEDGQVGRALSEPMSEDLVRGAEEAGLEGSKEFKGRLARASTEDGSSIYLLITAKDMQADAELDIQEDDVRQKLQDAGFQDIQFMDDAQIVRGTLEDDNVFVFAGRDLMGRDGMQQ